MKVYKDFEHCVSLAPFSLRGGRHIMISVGLYAVFNPAENSAQSAVRSEQEFWKAAPALFAALGKPPVMDANLPKTGGEVLVAGCCRAPGGTPIPAGEVSFRVGPVARRLAVFGDRLHLPGGGISRPVPFAAMPLTWDHAFGGAAFPANPEGKGLLPDGKPSEHLPNLEDPSRLIASPHDRPRPVCPFAVDIANEERRSLAGTYDQHWLDTRWPAYPDDLNPDFFFSAQAEQRLSGASAFFRGDEDIEITGMHHEYPRLRSRLPGIRVRAFVTINPDFAPFAQSAPGQPHPLPYAKDLKLTGRFTEVDLHLDTVWLLPDLCAAFVLYRGLLPVVDDEMDDILRVYVVSEKLEDAPKDAAFYFEEQKKRIKPVVEIDLAPFIEAQGKITKTVKMARDVPKFFEKVRKNILGESPVMPFSLDDMAQSARKTLATARATLDTLEKQVLEQRAMFSHLMSFDVFSLREMRAIVDEQEKTVETIFRRAAGKLRRTEKDIAKAKEGLAAQWKTATEKAPEFPLPPLDEQMTKLDSLMPDALLSRPAPLNPWHDRGFSLLVEARRCLRRHDDALAFLVSLGFEERTLEETWIGYGPEPVQDIPERWGLPEGEAFTLPVGLLVPRFAGRALTALTVYPLSADDIAEQRFDPAVRFVVPGSDPAPLSLPPSYPGGAVLVVADELSALFAEQEAGDFCHIVAAATPQDFAQAQGLPPLAPPPDSAASASETATAPAVQTVVPSVRVVPAASVPQEMVAPLALLLPPGPEGERGLKAWQENHSGIIPVFLPEDCPHVFALAGRGYRLRRLALDALPPAVARTHDFDFPLPPKDEPIKPFTLNLPLPDGKELSGRVAKLMNEVRARFPSPEQTLAEELAKHKSGLQDLLRDPRIPPEVVNAVTTAFDAANSPAAAPPSMPTVAEVVGKAREHLESQRVLLAEKLPDNFPKPDVARMRTKLDGLEKRLAPVEAFAEEGKKKLAAAKEMFAKGNLPEDVKSAFAAKGMDPNALKKPSREEVVQWLAEGKSLSRRNLMGLDLSGLDFSGADISHALCSGTLFSNCRMVGTDFTFTIADGADFSKAVLHEALFTQSVLQRAILRGADCSRSRWKLATLQESDCTDAVFDNAVISLTTWDKAVLRKARFAETDLSLSAFGESDCAEADFRRVRCYKCLFRQTPLHGASFQEATLRETLLQGVIGPSLSFAGADLRQLYLDMESDLSQADFRGTDLRDASLRMSRLPQTDFSHARLENALIVQCDLRESRLSGLRAAGCRFSKCDLTGATLSGSSLLGGSLRKCRLVGARLSNTNLYASDLRDLVISQPFLGGTPPAEQDAHAVTRFDGANLKRTMLHGKLEVLRL